VGDREVQQGQEDQHEARDPHEVPGPGLEVGLGLAVDDGCPLAGGHGLGGRSHQRILPSMKGQRITIEPGMPAARVTNTTRPVSIFSLRITPGKKSTSTMRRPFIEWYSSANSRPHSNRRSRMLP